MLLGDRELEENIKSLSGWLSRDQVKRIFEALQSGKLSPEHYYSLGSEYVMENVDNGGFTPRDQYLMEFANDYASMGR